MQATTKERVRGRLVLGKADYNNSGRRNCECAIEWELTDGRFTASAEVWNPRHTDIYQGGQCVDTVAAMFPENEKARRIVEVWRRWHLNDMKAGTPAQETFLRETSERFPGYPTSHYEWASDLLARNGLNPDNGYTYGSKWLREEIPDDVIAEIRSW